MIDANDHEEIHALLIMLGYEWITSATSSDEWLCSPAPASRVLAGATHIEGASWAELTASGRILQHLVSIDAVKRHAERWVYFTAVCANSDGSV